MPLYILKTEDEFNEIILEQRLNVILFTVCWSFGSKIIFSRIFNLSLNDIHVYRMDFDENNHEFFQRLNIISIPTIHWYFHGKKLDELIGIDHDEFIHKTYHLVNMYSNQKFVIDLLISIFLLFIFSTTISSILTTNWKIDSNNSSRRGLFRQCLKINSCQIKELNRTITMFILFSIILLLTSTSSSFLLMGKTIDRKNRSYILVPLTLFAAGVSMTMAFIKIHEQTSVNGYSAFIFLIDIVLAYVLGGISILHGSMFYF